MGRHSYPYIIGIDEAGRGPIAGPIAVGSFVFLNPEVRVLFKSVKESKQLNESQREAWFHTIDSLKHRGHVNYSVSFISHHIIDSKGLTFSVKKGLAECLTALKIPSTKCTVLLDGLLKAPERFKNQRTIVGGDDKYMAIALASICAKVMRDRVMREFADLYPMYGFESNKGYGSDFHYEALKEHGLSPIHRKRFLTRMFEEEVSW